MIAVILAITGLALAVSQLPSAQAATTNATTAVVAAKPTIVLEHGAWADASSWAGVIRLLQADGYTVYAPPEPAAGPGL